MKPISHGFVPFRLSQAATAEPRPRRTVFVPLAEVTEAGRLHDAVLRALSVVSLPGEAPLDPLAAVLGGQSGTLLILDNFEQLVERDEAEATLAAARRCRGEPRFPEAWAQGAALSAEQVAASAPGVPRVAAIEWSLFSVHRADPANLESLWRVRQQNGGV
jgi:hypothetical protein